ncbi:hypothetical protein [Sansalvadorimonas verongulae]|uniref:hypothetical protein n=1 Tax=Sansalvadorimonas verongulae TaxID=2172824 RepID=UPI0012BCFA80|nr:hypothetical protein [Sansalvadorimonas verongulae]MTI14444.1 hypothetical protein [Sansalvadorimonas verongulae]
MLKVQDLLVTLKILSFEDRDKHRDSDLQGKAWLHHSDSIEEISQYDRGQEDMVVSEEIRDIGRSDLDKIEKYLQESEPHTSSWTYRKLANELFISLSEANNAVKRATAARLLVRRGNKGVRVNRPTLVNFIQHGAPVAFFVAEGRIVRGIPTAHAAPVFDDVFASSSELPPVWPSAHGTKRGVAITPLYRSVTKAVMIDPLLYRHLSIVDIYRIGTAREREEALSFLNEIAQ